MLALKANQGQLHEDVKLLFDGIADGRLPDVETDTAQTVDGDHGRIETRTAITISDPFLIAPLRGSENFVNLNSEVMLNENTTDTLPLSLVTISLRCQPMRRNCLRQSELIGLLKTRVIGC